MEASQLYSTVPTGMPVVRKQDPIWLRWGKNGFAGMLAALVTLTYSVSYAALIFSGKMEPYLAFGIQSALLSAMLIGCCVAWASSFSFAIAGPDSNASAFLALMVAQVAMGVAVSSKPVSLWSTVFVTLCCCSVVTGFLLFALGTLRLGRVIRFIPYPVVGGFLAGTGWLIVKGAASVMVVVPVVWSEPGFWFQPAVLLQWAPGCVVALCLFVVLRLFRHPVLMPLLLVCFFVLFYLVIWTAGWSLAEARQAGLLLAPVPSVHMGQLWQSFAWKHVHWMLLWEQGTNLLAMTAVVAITILLNATGLELATMKDVQLDHELRVAGMANMVVGFLGGMIGYLSVSRSLLNFKAGATHRMAGLFAAILCGLLMFWGSHVLVLLPKPVLGGVLLYLGLGLLWDWLIDAWKKLSLFDYWLVVVILVVIATQGFLAGVGVGVVFACLIFALSYSRINVIKHELTGHSRQSNVERSLSLQAQLQQHASQIYVLVLQGYIFFGTAAALLDHVRKKLESIQSTDTPIRYLLLDFRLVGDVDSSAILSFLKMRQLSVLHRVTLLYVNLSPNIQELLVSNQCLGPNPEACVFADLDHGIEWCEEHILEEMDPTRTMIVSLQDMLRAQFPNQLVVSRLMDYLEPVDLARGEFLFREGEISDGLYFLERGRISVLVALPDGRVKRLRKMGAGTVVGEMGLYLDAPRSATVIAEQESRLYRLSCEAMEKILEEEPLLASDIHHFVVRMLAVRLAHANRELSVFHHH